MAQGFGNPKGPHYGLGRINVAVPGTPASLNQNVSTKEPFSQTGTPLTANTLIFSASPTNVGIIFVVFNGGNKGVPNSIVMSLAPGQTQSLSIAFPSNPFSLTEYQIDANSAGDGCYVTAVVI